MTKKGTKWIQQRKGLLFSAGGSVCYARGEVAIGKESSHSIAAPYSYGNLSFSARYRATGEVMRKVDAVIFDLYNTLLDNKTDEERQDSYEFLSLWLSYHGVRIQPVALRRLYLDLCHQEMSRCAGDFPDIEIGKVFSAMLALPGGPPVPGLLVAELALLFRIWTTDRISPFPGVIPLLDALKGRVKLGIASNAQRLFTVPELARFEMAAYFDAMVFSSDLGVCKPDPGLFHAALDALSVPPERAIFVGDNPEADIEGAEGVGMRAIWINGGREVGDLGGIHPDYEVRSCIELKELLLSLL